MNCIQDNTDGRLEREGEEEMSTMDVNSHQI